MCVRELDTLEINNERGVWLFCSVPVRLCGLEVPHD